MLARLQSFACAGIIVMILCGIVAPTRAATPADTIVMAKAIDDMFTLDPAEVYGLSDGEIMSNLYDRVMRFEPEDLAKLEEEAVESWAVSDDGKTFTFKVRPGQIFHSGNPLTAEDIAFSLQRVVILNKAPAFLLNQLGWSPEDVREHIRALDADTFILKIEKDYSPGLVLDLLSSSVASIVDEKTVMAHEVDGDLGNAWLKTHDAGSGPYVLRSWQPNDSVVMEASSNYRLGLPAIKRVVIKHTPEAATQRLLLEKGDADVARNLTADQLAGLAGNPNIAVTGHVSGEFLYLALNQKDPRLANPKVRQAIRYLVDYRGMVESFLKGQCVIHQAFWPSGFYAALDDNPFSLDVAKAKQLLAEAGYPDGFALRLDAANSAPYSDIAQSVQHSMAEAGIRVDIVSGDYKQVATITRARKHEIALLHWSSDYMDPHSNASAFAYNIDNSDNPKSKVPAWRSAWLIPELSQETEAALREKDSEKRKQLYLDIQRKVQADSPFVIMFQMTPQIAAGSNVKGLVIGPTYDSVFYRLMSK